MDTPILVQIVPAQPVLTVMVAPETKTIVSQIQTGAPGITGPAGTNGTNGSDANVTQGNIASALGYTPVSPAQLATAVSTAEGFSVVVSQAADDDALAYSIAL